MNTLEQWRRYSDEEKYTHEDPVLRAVFSVLDWLAIYGALDSALSNDECERVRRVEQLEESLREEIRLSS